VLQHLLNALAAVPPGHLELSAKKSS